MSVHDCALPDLPNFGHLLLPYAVNMARPEQVARCDV